MVNPNDALHEAILKPEPSAEEYAYEVQAVDLMAGDSTVVRFVHILNTQVRAEVKQTEQGWLYSVLTPGEPPTNTSVNSRPEGIARALSENFDVDPTQTCE